MTLEEWLNYGVTNKYLLIVNEKYKLTNNLQRDADNLSSSSTPNTNLPVVSGGQLTKRTTLGNIEELYHQFILDSKVPSRINNGKGGWYNGNRFSNKAAVEFARIMKGGINYQALVLATRLYYEITKECAVTITNYICDGGWRTKYYEVLKRSEEGNLIESINKEISDSNPSNVESL